MSTVENIRQPWLLYEGEELYRPHEVNGYHTPAFEGGYKQNILVVYDNGQPGPLEASQKEQLLKILAALKLTIDDIALADAHELYAYGIAGWINDGPPFNKFIAFGASALNMGLTVRLKRYFISNFDGRDYLFADSLTGIMTEPKLKSQLWTVLQVMFGIKK